MKTQFEKDKEKMRSWYMTQAQLDAFCFEEQNKDATTFQAFLAGYFRAVAKHADSEDGKLPIPHVIHCPNCNGVNLGIGRIFNHRCKDCNEVFD